MDEKRIKQILEQSFLKEYLSDEGITDLRWNGTDLRLQHNEKGYFRAGNQPTIDQVKRITKQISDLQKKEFTNSNPILDTEIGYLRVNAMHEAASPDGMSLAIRVSRPRIAVRSINELTTAENADIEQLLKVLVQAGSNIIISGRTGTGKTELQKYLVGFINDDVPIVLAEDTRDSHIKKLYPEKDIMSWQTLLSDDRDKKISMQDLNKAGLRNNPDWFIISETRGEEASNMLDSAKTDHSIITTVHAKGAMNIPSRLIPMIRQASAYQSMDELLLGKEITELLRFGIHLGLELEDGKIVRKIKEIVEYTGYTEDGVVGNYLYRENRDYNEETGEYISTENLQTVSKKTLQELKNKKLYHLLPNVFVNDQKDDANKTHRILEGVL